MRPRTRMLAIGGLNLALALAIGLGVAFGISHSMPNPLPVRERIAVERIVAAGPARMTLYIRKGDGFVAKGVEGVDKNHDDDEIGIVEDVPADQGAWFVGTRCATCTGDNVSYLKAVLHVHSKDEIDEDVFDNRISRRITTGR